MSQVTVRWVLEEVDRLVPNACTEEQKRHWLLQAETFAARIAGEQMPEGGLRDDTLLLAQVPYDNLYCRYVEAQIYYALGEMSRYNNAITAWNELLLTWRDDCARGAGTGRVTALKLC